MISAVIRHGGSVEALANQVFDGIEQELNYIMTHPEVSEAFLRDRVDGIMDGRVNDAPNSTKVIEQLALEAIDATPAKL